MNNSNSIPPELPTFAPNPVPAPLGAAPEEQVPIPNVTGAFEAILRQPRRVMFQLGQTDARQLRLALLLLAILCSFLYGLVVGAFSGGMQFWAAPIKIAGGLLLAALICLPSLYIFACLSGAQARLVDVAGLLAGLLCLTAVLLIGFAPVAWIFSQSTESVAAMGAMHLLFGVIAVAFGLRFLHAGFKHLQVGASIGLKIWGLMFILVLLQMTTALRPIVGTADTFFPREKQFFLEHWLRSIGPTEPPPARPAHSSDQAGRSSDSE